MQRKVGSGTSSADTAVPLLQVEDLRVHFDRGAHGLVRAVDGVSFDIPRGSTFGIVGESGSGKSTLARAVLGLLRPTNGTIRYDGQDVTGLRGESGRRYRRNVQAVFQDPRASINPRMTVEQAVADPLRAFGDPNDRGSQRQRVLELLDSVGLSPAFVSRYPNQLSGGQLQRVAIARALALNPNLVVLDEPVSALDVSIAAQVMNLLRELQARLSLTYLMIAHDLGVVCHMSDRVGVMYLGQMVEMAPTEALVTQVLAGRSHPYTETLFAAMTPVEREERLEGRLMAGGEIPSPVDPPEGCRFHTRCPYVLPECDVVVPGSVPSPWIDGGSVACHLIGSSQSSEVGATHIRGAEERQAEREQYAQTAVSTRIEAPRSEGTASPLLEIRGLKIEIAARGTRTRVVDDLDLTIGAGETVGLVGESGSGKSITASAIMRVLPRAASIGGGTIRFRGRDLLGLSEREMRSEIRGGEIGMILQDPLSSLNPVFLIRNQISEAVKLHSSLPRQARIERTLELLRQVQIPDPRRVAEAYPHQLSGGMRQRIVGAISLAGAPSLLIADEPTTALDTTTQAQYLDLLRQLQNDTGMAILLITHDLGIVASVSHHVVVMYGGKVVEKGPTADVLAQPSHPYTQGLLASVPRLGREAAVLETIPGQQPASFNNIKGCRFAPRCKYAFDRCLEESPASFAVSAQHDAACFLVDDRDG
jgi:peptide/nickel transport system ATP-binding protein